MRKIFLSFRLLFVASICVRPTALNVNLDLNRVSNETAWSCFMVAE